MFEFDNLKNESNFKKHGLYLEEAINLWDSDYIIIPAKNLDEERFLILGEYKQQIYACIFTKREKIRLISFHRADKKLERFYYEKNK